MTNQTAAFVTPLRVIAITDADDLWSLWVTGLDARNVDLTAVGPDVLPDAWDAWADAPAQADFVVFRAGADASTLRAVERALASLETRAAVINDLRVGRDADPVALALLRRIMMRGGLVLSPSCAARDMAQALLTCHAGCTLRHEVCRPDPLPDATLDAAPGQSLTLFVSDAEITAGCPQILALAPETYDTGTVHILADAPLPDALRATLTQHVGATAAQVVVGDGADLDLRRAALRDAGVVVCLGADAATEISATEALAHGAELVCSALPRQMSGQGDPVHLFDADDPDGLRDAVANAAATAPRPALLRRWAAPYALRMFGPLAVTDALLRSCDAIQALAGPDVTWLSAPDAALPIMIRSDVMCAGGSRVVTIALECALAAPEVSLFQGDDDLLCDIAQVVRERGSSGLFRLSVMARLAQNPDPDQRLTLRVRSVGAAVLSNTDLCLGAPRMAEAPQIEMRSIRRAGPDDISLGLACASPLTELCRRERDGTWTIVSLHGADTTLTFPSPFGGSAAPAAYALTDGAAVAYMTGLPLAPSGAKAHEAKAGLGLSDLTDDIWDRGILRQPPALAHGLCMIDISQSGVMTPEAGDIVQLADGTFATVIDVANAPDGRQVQLCLDTPLDPAIHGAPQRLKFIGGRAWSGKAAARANAIAGDDLARACVFLPTDALSAFGPGRDMAILDQAGAEHAILWTQALPDGSSAIWLDGPIEGDVAGLHAIPSARAHGLTLARSCQPEDPGSVEAATAGRLLSIDPDTRVAPGDVLHVAQAGVRRVLRRTTDAAVPMIEVDLAVDIPSSGLAIRFASPAEIVAQDDADDTAITTLIATLSRRHTDGPADPEDTDTPRSLLIGSAHDMTRETLAALAFDLSSRGQDVDLVLLTQGTAPDSPQPIGGKIKVLHLPDTAQAAVAMAAARQAIDAQLAPLDLRHAARARLDAALTDALSPGTSATADALLRTVFRKRRYDAMVLAGPAARSIAADLARIRPLPPALLLRDDTGSDALDRPDADGLLRVSPEVLLHGGAAVPIAQGWRPYRIPEANFATRRVLFDGAVAGNDAAALAWFVETCWSSILAAVPDARLMVQSVADKDPFGDVPNLDMRQTPSDLEARRLIGSAAVAIYPQRATAPARDGWIGLPSACGAGDAAAMRKQVITLLRDQAGWRTARAVVPLMDTTRLDRIAADMGWTDEPIATPAAPKVNRTRRAPSPHLAASHEAAAAGNTLGAVFHAARALAVDPLCATAARVLARSAAQTQDRALTRAALDMAHTLEPGGQSAACLALELQASGLLPDLPPWVSPPFRLLPDVATPIPDLVADGSSPGPGWSAAEPWGVWSDGHTAQLSIALAPGDAPLWLDLTCHAHVQTPVPCGDMGVTLRADADDPVHAIVPRAPDAGPYLRVRLAPGGRDGRMAIVALRFDDPVLARAPDGSILDERLLGIALTGLRLASA